MFDSSMFKIVTDVSDRRGVSFMDIMGGRQFADIVAARCEAWLLARDAGRTYADIAKYFNVHHSTVIAGVRKLRPKAESDPEIGFIEARINLAKNFTEDNYRKALEALEAWRPAIRFSRHYDNQPVKADPAYSEKNRTRIKAGLTDKLQSARQIHEALGGVGESTGATRKTIEALCRLGEAQMVRKGRFVFYRRAS